MEKCCEGNILKLTSDIMKSVKLIIWDLDETLWTGVLSEGEINIIPKNKELIVMATDRGIVNSICSKNDEAPTLEKLKSLELEQFIVYPSISWNPKGKRIKQLIEDMKLREQNVLFIDDNISNINEALLYCKDLLVALPDELGEFYDYLSKLPVSDPTHKRLQQYKEMESKKKSFDDLNISDEEFLLQSNIRAELCYDCTENFDRILDLINRANQLNYTKIRLSEQELRDYLSDPSKKSGYVKVVDNYGDYGIVGFFGIHSGTAEHFLFSCRTLGMRVEQYVYSVLNYPTLQTVGDVIKNVDHSPAPAWINQNNTEDKTNSEEPSVTLEKLNTVFLKGPCDIDRISPYLAKVSNLTGEHNYVTKNGTLMLGFNHTAHIVQSLNITKEKIAEMVADTPFADEKMYSTAFFNPENSIVIYSMFADPILGIYERKGTKEKIVFGEWCHDVTNPENFDAYMTNSVFTSQTSFTKESLEKISKLYSYVGQITIEQVIEDLTIMRKNLSANTKLVLILCPELEHIRNESLAYKDMHIYYAKMNVSIREWAKEHENVKLIETCDLVTKQSDYWDIINHFSSVVYFQLAERIAQYITECSNETVSISKNLFLITLLKSELRRWGGKIKRFLRGKR